MAALAANQGTLIELASLTHFAVRKAGDAPGGLEIIAGGHE
jgi:hypothetical protein